MQNEEKTKRKYHAKSLKDVKIEEDKDWGNCHEIEVESKKLTFLPHGILTGLKTNFRGSGNKAKMTLKTKILLSIIIIFYVALFAFFIHQLIHAEFVYSTNPSAMLYKSQCGKIPLQEQNENCSILLAKVLKK